MKNISHQFDNQFMPVKALLIYQQSARAEDDAYQERDIYVESYDIGRNGKPINAHPLAPKEMRQLAELLQSSEELQTGFLNCEGLLPDCLLHIDNRHSGSVLWYTPACAPKMFFADALAITSGTAAVPPMVWKATKEQLSVYALKANKKPSVTTSLYYAPFFNIYENGTVCMGTVDIDLHQHTSLEEFMKQWESYFWNSYFSHLMQDFNPVNTNIVQLWKAQVAQQRSFPVAALKKSNLTIQHLLP